VNQISWNQINADHINVDQTTLDSVRAAGMSGWDDLQPRTKIAILVLVGLYMIWGTKKYG
jgi:hypothetical protein